MGVHVRHDDSGHSGWKLLIFLEKIWPILVVGGSLFAAWITKGQQLEATAQLAKETAIVASEVKTEQAVQKEIIDTIRKDQTEMKHDIKQILRAVR